MAWQSRYNGREWNVTAEGVYSRRPLSASPRGDLHRTDGEPMTVHRYLEAWAPELVNAARNTDVPIAILLMTLATENGTALYSSDGHLRVTQYRKEPGYTSDDETPHRISFGPCHILLSSARRVMAMPDLDRAWLSQADNNITAAAIFIANQRDLTGFDPIMVAAAYNAGGIYEARPGTSRYGNRWHLRSYGSHLDRAAAWFGDACRVLVSGP